MEKTKLGVSVGLIGAALYFTGLAGIIPLLVIAGYVLLFESNEWLKKVAVKSVAIVLFFSVLSAAIGLIGNGTSFLYDLMRFFNGSFSLTWLDRIISMLRTAISFVQVLVLLMHGLNALKQNDAKFSVVDKIVDGNK